MDYYFYQTLDEDVFDMLKNLYIPTVSYKIPQDIKTSEIVEQILEKRGLKPSDFNMTKIRKSFFKSFPRPAIIIPEYEGDKGTVLLSPFEEDDIYPGYLKLKLKFTLPPGSFATMLVKSLSKQGERLVSNC